MEKAGQTVTKDDLARTLWPSSSVDIERGLDTAAKKLRRALDDDPSRPLYIETVRGKGYKFIGKIMDSKPIGEAVPPFQVTEIDKSPSLAWPKSGDPPRKVIRSAVFVSLLMLIGVPLAWMLH